MSKCRSKLLFFDLVSIVAPLELEDYSEMQNMNIVGLRTSSSLVVSTNLKAFNPASSSNLYDQDSSPSNCIVANKMGHRDLFGLSF